MKKSSEDNSLRPLRRLWPYLHKYRFPMLGGMVCVLLSNIFSTASPWVLKNAIDALKSGSKEHSFAYYAWLILGITFLAATFLFLMRRVMIGVSRQIEYDLRNDLYGHLQVLSTSYYNRMYTGDLMSRANNDLSAVRMVLGPAIMYSVNTFFTFVLALARMIQIQPALTVLALLPLPLISWLVTRYGKVIHSRFKDVQEQFSELSTNVQENLSGIKVVKAFGREQQEIDQFRAENQKYLELNKKLIRIWGVLYPMVEMLAGIGILIVLWWGGRSVILGHLTLGEFVAFNTYLGMLIWPSIALGWVVNITQRGAASMTRLNEIFDEQPEIRNEEITSVPENYKLAGKIEFRNVSFAYKQQPVLRDLSFVVEPGKTAAFVGATGGGKTTLLHFIPRMLQPDAGEILIDNIPIRNFPLQTLRSQVAVVPQDAFLFSDTLEENIAFGAPQADLQEIEQAAQLAYFDTEIRGFPQGYKTVIGERGITLSGGQKQRATLARALVKDSAILVLDDSFSNVDTYTEEQILQNLRDFRKGRTCIMIAHRISTIQDADWIFVLENGRIIEQGTHSNLLRSQGVYYDLYQKQLIEEELHIRH